MKKLRLLPILFLLLPQLPAADPAAPAPAFKFSLLSLDGDLDDLYFHEGGKIRTVEAPADFLLPPSSYRGGPPLQLFPGPPPAAEEKHPPETPAPAPLVSLQPARSGTYLVLLQKNPAGQHQAFWIEAEDLSAAANNWNFVNLSNQPVLGIFDKKKIQVLPGKSTTLALGNQPRYLQGELFLPGKDRWQLAYTTRFYHQPNRPRTYFILPSAASSTHLQLKGIAAVNGLPEENPPSANQRR